jgi:2'-5' RNA ligase
VRLFLAIEICDAVRERAVEIVAAAKTSLPGTSAVRWIPRENLHITLWFIGEAPEARAAAILAAINRPFETSSFDVHFEGLGSFPRSGTPRVLWLGVKKGAESLAALHGELATRLHALGLEPEPRPFSAHLTLGRVKSTRDSAPGRELRRQWQALEADAGICRVEALTLFQSRLSPAGAAYHPLLRVPLAEEP